ncbi:MAG: trypsin-like peptidase domain-containing protein [Acidobacteriota bacterium]
MNAFDPIDPPPNRRTSWPLRALVLAPLVLAAFWAGSAWRLSSDADVSPPSEASLERAPAAETAPATRRAAAAPSAAEADMSSLWSVEQATVELFKTASPSVVYITTLQNSRNRFSGRVYQTQAGAGSGFVWDRDGHIVTNYHVVRGVVASLASRRGGRSRVPVQVAQVTLFDQTAHEAEIVGIAPEKDLAVLKIDPKGLELEPLPVGDSVSLQVGQSVFAIGNPFGLDYTLTTGVVSALGREIEGLDRTPIRDVVQTDAAINPGNSGGPLLDSRGRLIGVNTQIYSPSGASAGIGFSIPVDTVSWVVPDLIEHGRVIRPVLGIETDPALQRRVGLSEGILVRNVTPGSGAEDAGLRGLYQDRSGRWQIGDIILAIGDEKVNSTQELRLALESFSVGDEITVRILRDSEQTEVKVRLGDMR